MGQIAQTRTLDTQLFRDVFNASPIGIAVENLDGQPLFLNPAFCAMLGFSEQELSQKHWGDISPREDTEKDWALFQQLRAGAIDHYQVEKRYFRKDGSLIWGSLNVSLLKNHSSPLVLAMVEDITEKKSLEGAQFRQVAIVESSEDAIICKNLNGVITSWNPAAQQLFGYTEDEAVGRPVTILIPPELQPEESNILERIGSGKRIKQYETIRVTKAGRRILVSLSISPIKDSNGRVVGASKIARDITTRKQAEEALRSSEQRYRLLFERNVAGVAIASVNARLLDCNDGWVRILGYESKNELLGRHASEFYFNPAERKPLVDELFEKQVLFSRDLQLRRKDGTPVWVLFNAAVHSDDDRPIVQATMIDISAWKSAEEALSGMTRKLIESQEQERARIARELHDDINQQLALLAAELQQASARSSQSHLAAAQERLFAIADDVQSLSHELHSSKLEYLGVVAGIRSCCQEFGERRKMEIQFSSNVANALSQEIGLTLLRILQEALHNAMKHSGTRRVEVQLRDVSDEIHLIVSDRGRGFDTEAALQGKGLGLTSMRERVRLVNGRITIDSKLMGGTTIHVCVPLPSRQHPRVAG